jgi:transcriptional regulator with XRE-family HTH domain
MATQDLLNRISQLPQRPTDVPTSPPAEVVGFVVRWNRGLRQWKTSTLADFARVSISTIERVERGEKVGDESLDRIAEALGYEAGYFTRPRIPTSPEDATARMVETYSNLETVPVAPMRSHRAVREAARCDAYLVHRPGVPDAYAGDIANLQEWLDLASFVLSDIADGGSLGERGRRDLYNDILASVRELERRGLTVLCGVMSAPQDRLPDWKVAVISITPRITDPGAAKRRHIMVDRRAVAMPSG